MPHYLINRLDTPLKMKYHFFRTISDNGSEIVSGGCVSREIWRRESGVPEKDFFIPPTFGRRGIFFYYNHVFYICLSIYRLSTAITHGRFPPGQALLADARVWQGFYPVLWDIPEADEGKNRCVADRGVLLQRTKSNHLPGHVTGDSPRPLHNS
jgi:hypothetical protein